jgi:glycosyltransferase involved in cell wall biosynthesis
MSVARPEVADVAASGRAERAPRLRLLVYEQDADSGGGNRQHLCLLLKHGPQAGMDVVLVTPEEKDLASVARAYGTVVALNRDGGRIPYLVRCWRLVTLIRTMKPDAVLCNNTWSFGTGLVAGRLARTRVFWYVKRTRRKMQDLVCGLVADRTFTISRSVFGETGWLAAFLARRTTHLPIGVELDRFMAVPPPPAGPHLRVLVLSRLHPDKGLDVLFDALERLGPAAAGIEVTICGGVPAGRETYAATIAQRAAAAAPATVRLLGFRDDVPALLAAADAVVLTSRSEGVPRSVVEAMAAARPVLATRIGGVGDLITAGETGLLVDSADPDGVARMLTWLRSHPAERQAIGERARRHVAERFDIAGHVRALAREVSGAGASR